MSEMKAIRTAYGEALVALGHENKRVVVLDADLSHATMTTLFAHEFPERFFNAGIAEANMVDMSAGLAYMGFIPFVSTFAVFSGRAFEQIRNGVCYSNLNVKFGMTHAGITVGEDGGTHQAIADLALMRALPGMTIFCPCDANETSAAVRAAANLKGPVYLRLARLPSPLLPPALFIPGKANILREGTDVALMTCGTMVSICLDAAEILQRRGIQATVVNVHTIKPIDCKTILQCAERCGCMMSIEEHSVIGGLGDAVGSILLENSIAIAFRKIGIQDRFGQSGKPEDLLKEYELDTNGIVRSVEHFVKGAK